MRENFLEGKISKKKFSEMLDNAVKVLRVNVDETGKEKLKDAILFHLYSEDEDDYYFYMRNGDTIEVNYTIKIDWESLRIWNKVFENIKEGT